MSYRRNDEPSLKKIFLVLLIAAVVVVAVFQVLLYLNEEEYGPAAAEAAEKRLTQARKLLENDQRQEAVELLQHLADEGGERTAPEAMELLADVQAKSGDAEAAMATLKQAVEQFPQNPEQPRLRIEYARLLEQTGNSEDAAQIYRTLSEAAPPELRAPALVGAARQKEAQGDLLAARAMYAQAAQDAPWDSKAWQEAVDALGRANAALVFSSAETPDSRVYEVQSGDTLIGIGNKLNVTQGMLMRANDLEEAGNLRVGQRLKYTPKDFRIIIERSQCRLFLLDKDGIFKVYSAGLGKPGYETTLGRYKLGNKQKNPAWFKPGEGMIPPLDPRNELGTRWMPLIPLEEGLPSDLGIHGTIEPDTVGDFSSHGCARLLPAEVEELYDLVVRSTPVYIVENLKPSEVSKPGVDAAAMENAA